METIIKVLLLLFVSALLGCSGDPRESSTSDSALSGLVRGHSSNDLAAQFKASLVKRYGTYSPNQRSEFLLASTSALVTQPRVRSFSTTTLQEKNVEESDRLKTDGQYLYASSITTPRIKIFKADKGDAPLISELLVNTFNGSLLSGLYLRSDKKQLVAMSGDGNSGGERSWFSANYWNDRKTEIFIVDVSSPTTPKQITKLSADGLLISSRRIGSMLHLVTRHTAKIPNLIESPENPAEAASNRMLIADTPMNAMLPKYSINGKQRQLFDSEDCFYADSKQTSYQQHGIISLLSINLDDALPSPKGQCFIGDTETLYASNKSIYLATTEYPYAEQSSDVVYEGSPTTEIHKFSLDGMQTHYAGSASIEGHLGWKQGLKSFRMSEEKGVLRVLSYVGEQVDSVNSPARLHMLKENPSNTSLDIIATLPNERRPEALGKKGEQIYASRFLGDRGYLVTFRATDPLYIVDLSNAHDPYILSALEINGYSDYLHPVGKNYLLGIGKDAIAQTADSDDHNATRGAWYQGVKLSLIDISDPTAPFEKETIIFGKRGTETAVSLTHHALTSLLKGGLLQINIPVSLHEKAVENHAPADHPSDHFGWTRDALHRLDIDIKSGEMTQLKPIIARLDDVPESAEYFIDTGWQHDRSAILGDDVYYLKHDNIFTSSDSLQN